MRNFFTVFVEPNSFDTVLPSKALQGHAITRTTGQQGQQQQQEQKQEQEEKQKGNQKRKQEQEQ